MKSTHLYSVCLATISGWSGVSSAFAQPAGAPASGGRLRSLLESRSGADAKSAPASNSHVVYQDWTDTKRSRTLPVKIYLPTTGSAPYPVMIFSHGLGGSREAAGYLGDCWAEHGYLCVFVQHPGSDTSAWESSRGKGREAILENLKGAANAQNAIARAADISFVLDEIERRSQNDPVIGKKMDLGKIGLAGHSFGAGTTLAIAGQNYVHTNKRDGRIKAAIYLCPPVSKQMSPEQTYGDIKIPGLLLTGTEDNSPINDTKAADRRIPFDGMKAPHQYLVNFVGADHATFGGRSFRQAKDGDDQFHTMISKVATEFLDATLKNDKAAWKWLDSAEMTDYLGKAAMVEKK